MDNFWDQNCFQNCSKKKQKLNPNIFIKMLKLIASLFFECFFATFATHFGPPSWDQIHLKGTKQDKPKRAIRSFKEPKNCINKKWFSRWTVGIFSLLRPLKRASRGPRRLPRGTQRAPKPPKTEIQNWTHKLTHFEKIGAILASKSDLKTALKMGPLLAPPSPASQGSK